MRISVDKRPIVSSPNGAITDHRKRRLYARENSGRGKAGDDVGDQ